MVGTVSDNEHNEPAPSIAPDSTALVDTAAPEDTALCAAEYNDNVPRPSTQSVARVWEVANSDGTMRKVIKAKPSAFISALIHLNGAPFSLLGREYLLPIYDRGDKQILLVFSRQTEKSTLLSNNLAIKSIVKPFTTSLYVSPSHSQTRMFSSSRMKPLLEFSPLIAKYYQSTAVAQMVFERGLTNGSYIFLRSAFRSADRARGISVSGALTLDELQDFYTSEIPVILECTSHYPDASTVFAGTPKTMDNPIQLYWESSTQNEWLVPCGACNHWNFLDEQNIAPTEMYTSGKLPPGPVCKKCMKPINPARGRWMCFSPGKAIQGYRVCQLMVPWCINTMDQWAKILWKRDNYPLSQLYNEVLGLSYDGASKPITKDQLISLCDVNHRLLPDVPTAAKVAHVRQHSQLCAGVDWGTGGDSSERSPSGKLQPASYSVLTLGTYVNQHTFKVHYIRKYTGKYADPNYVVGDIVRVCEMYNVKTVGVDWGFGWGVNNDLVRRLPNGPKRVIQIQYVPKQKEPCKYDPAGWKFQLHRNLYISELFHAMKTGHIALPSWKEFEPYAADILAIYSEYSEYAREIRYDHRLTTPDDVFHAILFNKFAADVYHGKVTKV